MTVRTRRETRRDALREARRDGDRGTFSSFTVIFALAVLLFAGLLIDGGLAIHARQRAFDIAEQAARAGANEIDLDHLRETGEPLITDYGAACGAADELLGNYPEISGSQCGAGEGENEVSVTVTKTVNPTLLSLVHPAPFTMTVTATAHPQEGL
ncbi:Tad domain-containing protein [Actinocorallia longicatena]|uniref:Putative Flp pilus-assembly TadG-like N-terminal domain-containing protein n=1 Tax=Actinocorallia longicatena TaxID=111803 RepID=A0ABP6QJF6_9ACTN